MIARKYFHWYTAFAVLVLLVALVACGDSATNTPSVATSAPTSAAVATATVAPPATASNENATLAALPTSAPITAVPDTISLNFPPTQAVTLPIVVAAKADLVKRTKVQATDVQLGGLLPQQWPDSSLGCPAPGQMYSQIVTSGYLITLVAGGQKYVYHTNQADTVILCGADGKPVK